jgi:calcineurin-like phosphoesterase
MKIVVNYRIGNVTGNITTYNDHDEFMLPKAGETVITDLGATGVVRKVSGPFRHSNRTSYIVEL